MLAQLHRAEDVMTGGRQMPGHYGKKELNVPTQSSPTGTQFLQAVGTAIGCVRDGKEQVVYVSSGEGATSEGEFSEALNWASREKLPVVFCIEDNHYAISVPEWQQTAGGSVYDIVQGYANLRVTRWTAPTSSEALTSQERRWHEQGAAKDRA